jgi:hypothetical protein
MEPGSADCSSIRTTLDDDDCDAESERSVGVHPHRPFTLARSDPAGLSGREGLRAN